MEVCSCCMELLKHNVHAPYRVYCWAYLAVSWFSPALSACVRPAAPTSSNARVQLQQPRPLLPLHRLEAESNHVFAWYCLLGWCLSRTLYWPISTRLVYHDSVVSILPGALYLSQMSGIVIWLLDPVLPYEPQASLHRIGWHCRKGQSPVFSQAQQASTPVHSSSLHMHTFRG